MNWGLKRLDNNNSGRCIAGSILSRHDGSAILRTPELAVTNTTRSVALAVGEGLEAAE